MAFLGKEYKLVSQENYDGLLRSTGLPEDKIQILAGFKPAETLVKDGDTYTFTTTTPTGSTKTVSFKSGVEFDDVIGLGHNVKSTFTVEGNTVTHKISGEQGTGTITKEFNGDDLVITITSAAFDGVAKRFFKA